MFDARDQIMTAITVAEAGPADRETVLRFYHQLVLAHGHERTLDGSREKLGQILSAPYRVHLLRRADQIVGSAVWMEMGDHVFIRHFTIDTAVRGQGVGAAAFAALEAACFSGREVELDVSTGMEAPLAFWQAHGFHPIGTLLRRDMKEDL